MTALVKRLIREGSHLSEDLIAFIVHETLKVVKARTSAIRDFTYVQYSVHFRTKCNIFS